MMDTHKKLFPKIISLVAFAGLAAVLIVSFAVPFSAHAQDSLALTITPPFFEINVNPGDAWASSIKVVNANAGALPVYATVMGFAPSDEQGHGTFIDASSLANDRDALANWIVTPHHPVTVAPGSATDIPFSFSVPPDASPGGHYAAILIGTGPASTGAIGSHVGVSSFISALIFVRVGGEINEQGDIREFSTPQATYEQPDVQFTLRFQNTGNVHLRPMGEIEIYNAWGKERGKIDVNQGGDLGYVLPSSTREFDFEWKGTPSIFDVGPYTAVATLTYGENGSKNVTRTIGFWVLPIWSLLEVIIGTLFFLGIFVIAIRRYVRKALRREMEKFGNFSAPPPVPQPFAAPRTVAEGTVDLRNMHRGQMQGEKFFGGGVPVKKWNTARIKKIIFYLCIALGLLWIGFLLKDTVGGGGSFEVRTSQPGQTAPWTPGATVQQ